MIFNVPGHIDMIRNGLYYASRGTFPESISLSTFSKKSKRNIEPIVKTQTRRLNRGMYYVGSNYAVQRKRGVKGEPDIRIVMDRIWEDRPPITMIDANAEGGYTSKSFENTFKKLNPKWDGWSRWAFEFHVIEVRKNVPGITSHAREERVQRTFYPEQTVGYPRL